MSIKSIRKIKSHYSAKSSAKHNAIEGSINDVAHSVTYLHRVKNSSEGSVEVSGHPGPCNSTYSRTADRGDYQIGIKEWDGGWGGMEGLEGRVKTLRA